MGEESIAAGSNPISQPAVGQAQPAPVDDLQARLDQLKK